MSTVRANKFQGLDAPNPAIQLPANGTATFAVGASGTPAIAASGDANTGIYFPAADTIGFAEGGNEAARIDSSGRLLVGTSSYSGNATLVLENNSGGTSFGHLRINRNSSSPADGNTLGLVTFSDNTTSYSADIYAARDGGTWSASSKPTRLVFSTTADGASSPTERMRITQDGTIQLRDTPGIDFSQIQTSAAGMTSETLDSYEEGTWTPTLGNFTGTYTTQTGIYTKIGNIVTLNVHINVATNTGTSTLQYWIQGMPFSIVGTPSSTVGPVYIYEAASDTGNMISSMSSSGRWYVHPNNGLTTATSTNGHQAGQLGTGQIFATMTYRVA